MMISFAPSVFVESIVWISAIATLRSKTAVVASLIWPIKAKIDLETIDGAQRFTLFQALHVI